MTTTKPNSQQAPVTPPPENMNFFKMPHPEDDEPFSMKAFQNPAFQNAQLKFQQAQSQGPFPQMPTSHPPRSPATSSHPSSSIPPRSTPQVHQQPPSQSQQGQSLSTQPETHPGMAGQSQQQPPLGPFGAFPMGAGGLHPAAAASLDPKYIAMVSRIASYYQQRCQAVANYQQQRCQAWAAMHRQKCQEMVQAAMLVVAWYIRDRIQRRRRRQKRTFRKGLKDRCGRSKVTKGEVVRRWVLQVPESAPSPSEPAPNRLVDNEEAEFDMDREVPIDKDSKLFGVADNLIKSQLSRIEVPLMGALSFDESESEFEEEEEPEEEQEELPQEEVPDLDDEEIYEDDDDIDMSFDYDDEDLGSDLVQNGTGEASHPQDESSIS